YLNKAASVPLPQGRVHETVKMHFTGEGLDQGGPLDADTQPRFLPTMASADLRLQPVEPIQGGSGLGAQNVKYYVPSLSKLSNPGNIWATLTTPKALTFSTDRSGGVITPNVSLQGLSTTLGPHGGPLDPDAAPQGFDPATFFAGLGSNGPKLLGAIDVIKLLTGTVSAQNLQAVGYGDGTKVPRLISRPDPANNQV